LSPRRNRDGDAAETRRNEFDGGPIQVGVQRIGDEDIECGSRRGRFILEQDRVGQHVCRRDPTLVPESGRADHLVRVKRSHDAGGAADAWANKGERLAHTIEEILHEHAPLFGGLEGLVNESASGPAEIRGSKDAADDGRAPEQGAKKAKTRADQSSGGD